MLTRYRVQTRWLRKPLIVLQVGTVRKTSDDDDDDDIPPNCQGIEYTVWRDAALEDLVIDLAGQPR